MNRKQKSAEKFSGKTNQYEENLRKALFGAVISTPQKKRIFGIAAHSSNFSYIPKGKPETNFRWKRKTRRSLIRYLAKWFLPLVVDGLINSDSKIFREFADIIDFVRDSNERRQPAKPNEAKLLRFAEKCGMTSKQRVRKTLREFTDAFRAEHNLTYSDEYIRTTCKNVGLLFKKGKSGRPRKLPTP